MRVGTQGFIKYTPVSFQGGARVDIAGRAKLCRDFSSINALSLQSAITVAKVVHGKVVPVLRQKSVFGFLGFVRQIQRTFLSTGTQQGNAACQRDNQ